MPMSGRVRRAAGVAGGALALALLSGCTLGAHPDVTATAPAVDASAPPPVGSIEHPRPVECLDGMTYPTVTSHGSPNGTTSGAVTGHTPATGAPSGQGPTRRAKGNPVPGPSSVPTAGPDDVTVGPLIWKGLRTLADGDQSTRGGRNSDGWHYRIITQVRPGAVVTVTVGAQQRARAGLEFGGGYGTAPAPAVTFHGCPAATTAFPGGFFVAGDGRACVPLDVRVGDGPARHVVVSFFNGRCPA